MAAARTKVESVEYWVSVVADISRLCSDLLGK